MPTIKFHVDSTLPADRVMAVLTDFSPARAQAWPGIDAEHFEVHSHGDHWAEVTEGTAAAWERSRYEWNDAAGRVEITSYDSKVLGPGAWVFQLTPESDGTRVDIELTRTPKDFKRKATALLMPLLRSSLAKSYAGPLQARGAAAAKAASTAVATAK